MSIVKEPVHNGIGKGGLGNIIIPILYWQLRYNDGRFKSIAIGYFGALAPNNFSQKIRKKRIIIDQTDG